MRIYVAGKWSDKAAIQQRMAVLKGFGHTLTHDWTQTEHDSSPEQCAYYAGLDVQGVLDSDALIMLLEDPKYAYRGTFTELGVALGRQHEPNPPRIYAVAPQDAWARTNVFLHHPVVKLYDSWEELLQQFSQ